MTLRSTQLPRERRSPPLHEPKTPVFDETHVGRFLNSYSSRAFFFDVHPPLAKLLMLSLSSALGFAGHASCPYESTAPYAASCDLAPQRLLPALCGSAVVPLALLSCGAMGLKPLSGLFAAWLILTDTLWLSLSRLHLNDMFGAALPTACWLVLHHLRVVATLWWEGKGEDGRLLGEAWLRATSLLAPPIVLHLVCFAAHIAIASEPGNGG
ncbi:MAG: hypothetical protein SGPRY_008771, partial [Prymnesium sp.]